MASEMVARQRARPTRGWRAAVYSASGGVCNPGLSAGEQRHRRLIELARTHLAGSHSVVVTSLKGGVGKTTIAACLALTLAEYRGDRIVALDANPDAGTLADRLTGDTGITMRDLATHLGTVASWTDIAHYTSLTGRLQVLASDQDPAASEAFNGAEYHAVCTLLAQFFNALITDCGTGMVHSAMSGALDRADTLIVAATPTLDGASRASKTLDWLIAHGYGQLVTRAVLVFSHDRSSRSVDQRSIREHFVERCHAVLDIPSDQHLATGGLISLEQLRPATREAFLRLGAQVAEQFAWNPVGAGTRTHRTSR